MSRQTSRFRSLVIAVIAIVATNAAISYGFSNRSNLPIVPELPRPKSGMPLVPELPRPRSGMPIAPELPRP